MVRRRALAGRVRMTDNWSCNLSVKREHSRRRVSGLSSESRKRRVAAGNQTRSSLCFLDLVHPRISLCKQLFHGMMLLRVILYDAIRKRNIITTIGLFIVAFD